MNAYRALARPVLFALDPEQAHGLTLSALAWASRNRWLREWISGVARIPSLPVSIIGLEFPNPLGVAAGMDKNGVAVPMWPALGFGFSELGGVTWHGQPGNPVPRLFRIPSEEAIINRMGFNNEGARALAMRLVDWRARGAWPAHPVGINLGKSKITPLEVAAEDYLASFKELWALADFFVVNVSSPNTPNLRQLQDRRELDQILATLQSANASLAGSMGRRKPILVKVAPDLSWEALDEILEVSLARDLAGIVATNTTITRPETADPAIGRLHQETGGLSGRPLRARSTEVIRYIHRQVGRRLPIIGVGGITTVDDAWEKVTAGASLLQMYSALVFQGPAIVGQIVEELRRRSAGAAWEDVVGSASGRT